MTEIDYQAKTMEWIKIIADKIKESHYQYKSVLHIIKHIETEMQNMVIQEGRLDDFLNSEMNLTFIFRIAHDMEPIDWKGMYERLQHHGEKAAQKVFNVLENGTVIDQRKKKMGEI